MSPAVHFYLKMIWERQKPLFLGGLPALAALHVLFSIPGIFIAMAVAVGTGIVTYATAIDFFGEKPRKEFFFSLPAPRLAPFWIGLWLSLVFVVILIAQTALIRAFGLDGVIIVSRASDLRFQFGDIPGCLALWAFSAATFWSPYLFFFREGVQHVAVFVSYIAIFPLYLFCVFAGRTANSFVIAALLLPLLVTVAVAALTFGARRFESADL